MKSMSSKPENSGRIEINMQAYEQIYGNYYMPGNPHLDNRLSEYILLQTNSKNKKDDLEICVWHGGRCEEGKFELALKNTFSDTIAGVEKEIHSNTIVALVSMLVGIVVGLGANLIFMEKPQILYVVVIAFWVFIWYSVETYFFDNMKLRLKIMRYRQIMNAKIRYEEWQELE